MDILRSPEKCGLTAEDYATISYHNHPAKDTWYSFSAQDIRFFFASGEECSYASDDLYEYIMLRTEETLDVDPDVVYHEFDTLLYTEAYPLAWSEVINPDTDNYHVIMTELSKKYGFLYERRRINGT